MREFARALTWRRGARLKLGHYRNVGRRSLYALLRRLVFGPISDGISERHCLCTEVMARNFKR